MTALTVTFIIKQALNRKTYVEKIFWSIGEICLFRIIDFFLVTIWKDKNLNWSFR